jgi:hypothetical protein
MVVDAYIYCKYYKSRGCIFGTNIAAKVSTIKPMNGDGTRIHFANDSVT